MPTITILSATDRPNSNALRVSNYLKPLYEKEGIEITMVSLEDFPLADVIGGRYGDSIPSIEAFNNRVLGSDGIVFVIPEYNGSFPGIFKLFIDYLPFPESFLGKPVAFVGEASGAFGALRAIEQAQMVCGYRNAYQFPERVFIDRVGKNFDPENGLAVPIQQKLLNSQVKNFAKFIKNEFPPQDLS